MVQKRIRTLIADDSLPIQELLSEYLTTRGCEVVETTDGQQAVALLESSIFDVVITDLRVPGSDGMEILRHALARNPPVPCLMMTGFASVDSAVASFKAGAVDYIEKPFRLRRVWEAIERAIEKARQLADLERSRTELELYRACEGAFTKTDFDLALQKLAACVAGLVQADDVQIVLAEPPGGATAWRVATRLSGQEPGVVSPFDLSEAALLLRRGRPAILNAPSADAPEDRTRTGRVLHLLALPMKALVQKDASSPKAGSPGGIFATRTAEKAGFSNEDLASLRHLALLLSNTIAHASRRDDADI